MEFLNEYAVYIQSLEKKADGGLFFHHINHQIYVTDFTHRLLGIWDMTLGRSIHWKDQHPKP